MIKKGEWENMKYKKSIILLVLAVFILSINCVSASELDDTLAIEDTNHNGLSVDNDIIEDNLQTSEENDELALTDNDETLSAKNDTDVLSDNSGTYSGLSAEIGSGGNIELQHDYYTYDGGNPIFIIVADSVIDGKGATINMTGSNIRAFYVIASGVTIKNLTIINANSNGDGGAIYFTGSGTVLNCNFVNNTASGDGGAVLFNDEGTVSNCNFTDNSATVYGGAVYFNGNGDVTNCNFAGKTANYNGGAVYFYKEANVTNCNFTGNTASNNGGAVYFNSNGEVTNCNFADNTADVGGAVYFNSNGEVTNCNFTNNKATGTGKYDGGGAVYFLYQGTVSNCNFADNTAYRGGAVYFSRNGEVTNCNFVNNTASGDGGAVRMSSGSVTDCNFTDNTASSQGGAVLFNDEGTVSNCNFINNTASGDGGAVLFNDEGTVSNCNFTDNSASGGGGAIWMDFGSVSNCNFTNNNAATGSAIYFFKSYSSDTLTVFKATFLNNRANAGALDVVKNDNNITITFTGRNNLLYAIYSRYDAEVTFTNVTYWGANGIATVSATLSGSNNAAGQKITVGVVVNDKLVLNEVMITDEEGMIVLNINAGDNYYITARHDTDSYYTEVEKAISNNTQFYVNVTSQATHNKTVNITAKSNIPNDFVQGKLLFILPNTNPITASYAGNGIWWAEHTFNDYGYFHVNASYVRVNNLTVNTAIIKVIEHSFAELQSNIIAATPGSTLTLNNDYECEDGFDTEGIIIDKPLTIDGQGNKIITKGNSRIFKITSDNVTLKNIIFINGKSTGSGGAVYFGDRTSGTVSNCNFINNTARDGGAVYFDDGTTGEVINCNFTDNAATSSGGSLVFLGTGTVTGCNFINNAGNSGSGGAIYFIKGNVSDCYFNNNKAVFGGAVYFKSFGNVTDCCFTNNQAIGYSGCGGAVYFDGGSYGETVNCIFDGNSASRCGAIYSRDALDVVADSCIFKSSFDTTDTARILAPILTVDNSTTIYDLGEKVVFDLKANNGMLINGNISISIYDNGEWIGNYSCLSFDGWAVDLPVGKYYAIYNTQYYGFSPVNMTIIVDESYKTFCGLNDTINGNDNPVINLYTDFYFESVYDSAFVNGIVINRPVTINGNGITIDARGKGRIFNVTAENVTLKNINFINGKIEGDGGAVIFYGEGTVINCNFTGNKATGDYSSGGAVYIGGNGNVTNCNFTLNTAYYGGAFYFKSNGNVANCNFTLNTASRVGGAVYFNSSGSVTNCTFIDNTGNDGGAVYFAKDTIGNVINCNFTGNTARYGGAVLFESNSNVTNCNFTDNTASGDGGAVFFNVDGSVTNCTFTGNTVKGSGGAVYFYNDGLTNCNSTGIVTNCTFTGNTVKGSGGAVFFSSEGIVSNCNFVNNTATGGGGAVYIRSNGIVSNCNFAGNTAGNGGAVYFLDQGTVTNCDFTGNTATGDGGAVRMSSGSVTDCNFTGNTITLGNGGAVYFKSNGNVTNCNFVDNKASGGAVYIGGNGNVTNCNFINNEANGYEYSGGAVYIGGNGNVTNCNFTGNTATRRSYGGAVYIGGNGNVTNCNFTRNNALWGGAIRMYSGSVENCNFTGNTGGIGGAVYFLNTGNVANCDFTGNTATGEGGAVRMSSGSVTDCNFTGNTAGGGVGGGAICGGNVVNCNFVNNKATEYHSPGASGFGGGAIRTSGNVTYCNFTNNSASHGGAVYLAWTGIQNLTFENFIANCNFVNNFAFSNGGAVSFDAVTAWGIKNCNFTNNSASFGGGAIECRYTGIIFEDCNFANNRAQYGGVIYVYHSHYWDSNIFIINCTFMDNIANHGSAIHLREGDASDVVLNISNSTFLNNRADAVDLQVYVNGSNVEIIFTGENYLLNAIDSINEFTANLYNVTYWGANGITNTDSSTPVKSNRSAGQNVTVFIVNGEHIESGVYVTDENGTIVLENVNLEGSYFISARHDTDSYYAEIERIISENMKYVVNVTSQTTKNKTVNITAKSNIYSEGMPGKLLFILPDGTEINATYGANGIWWAEYAFDDYGVYQVNASYVGLDNVTLSNGTIAVTAPEHTFWFLNYTINGNDNPVIELSNDFYFDSAYDSAFVNGIVINKPVTINGNGVVIDAKGQARIFDVQSEDTVIENLTLKNANYNSGNGGAIHFASSGTVSNCNFTNNTAYEGGAVYFTGAGIVSNCTFTGNTARWYGGALRFRYSSTVSNCTFTGNTATGSGGAIYSLSGTLTNCTFTGNTATGSGGAIMFASSTTVSNCNFNDNSASSGGAVWMSYGGVSNSNFICNNATTGSAIYFGSASTLSNSILLNNKADAEALDMVKNDDNITITFTGRNNLLNAIYSEGNVTFTNVTYWGANGITTDSATMSGSNKVAGQNVTVEVVVNGVLVLNDVYVTDENGTIVLENMNLDGNYFITVRHDDDSYYTRAETILTNMELHANVTSIATNNRTVNLTAKSNIYGGKFQFVLSDGTKIDANYASNGIWWAVYTFEDYAEYNVSASYLGSGNVTVGNGTITITRADSEITLDKTVFDYGDSINVATVGAVGITAKIDGNDVTVVDFTIPLSGLNAGTYNLAVTTIPDEDHNPVTVNATISINKLQTVLIGNAVTAVYNINKDLVITLKDAKGNPVTGASVTVNLNGLKTYTTDKNGQVKVSTKGLAPKAYTAKVTFNGNTNYDKSTKDVKVTVKKATPKLTAKKKTFKRTVKTKKYTIVLKDNNGKAMKKVKVTLKIKGKKTITVKTNSKGKATFKIKKLTKKGTYKSTVTFKGNKYYNKVVKKVKIKIK